MSIEIVSVTLVNASSCEVDFGKSHSCTAGTWSTLGTVKPGYNIKVRVPVGSFIRAGKKHKSLNLCLGKVEVDGVSFTASVQCQ